MNSFPSLITVLCNCCFSLGFNFQNIKPLSESVKLQVLPFMMPAHSEAGLEQSSPRSYTSTSGANEFQIAWTCLDNVANDGLHVSGLRFAKRKMA